MKEFVDEALKNQTMYEEIVSKLDEIFEKPYFVNCTDINVNQLYDTVTNTLQDRFGYDYNTVQKHLGIHDFARYINTKFYSKYNSLESTVNYKFRIYDIDMVKKLHPQIAELVAGIKGNTAYPYTYTDENNVVHPFVGKEGSITAFLDSVNFFSYIFAELVQSTEISVKNIWNEISTMKIWTEQYPFIGYVETPISDHISYNDFAIYFMNRYKKYIANVVYLIDREDYKLHPCTDLTFYITCLVAMKRVNMFYDC